MKVLFPTDLFNEFVRDGSIGDKLKKITDSIKPEAIYFTDTDGLRSALPVVDVPEASSIPLLAEPWFLTFEADVSFHIAMTPEDLQKSGIATIGNAW